MKRTYLARAVPILVASIAGAGLWACRDSTLPAHERIGPHVALALNPVFVAGAAAGIVPFEHARINLARIPGGAIALDTLVDFPPGVDQIAVRLEVPLSPDATSSGEDFTARFELINAAGVVVFVGGPITLHAGIDEMPTPVEISTRYSGPGANAVAVSISPATAIGIPGGTLDFTGNATDAIGALLPGTPVQWTSLDPAMVTFPDPASGHAVIGLVRGTAHIRATLLTGPTADAVITINPVAAAIALQSGNAQTGTAGTPLAQPFVVKATATDGLPIAGVVVTFTIQSGGGSLAASQVTTGSDGLARVVYTFGATAGSTTVLATATGLAGSPVTFTASGTQGAATQLALTTSAAGAASGVAFTTQPVVAVRDASGNTRTSDNSTMVTMTVSSGASVIGTASATAASGVARFTNVGIIGSPGMSYTLTYSAPGLTSATQNITLAGPALPTVSFTAAGQTVSEGDGTATITARLSGSSNQPVTVPFTVGGSATALADYAITASPLVIPAGSTSGSITVTLVNDALVEPDETVVVTLGTPTNATVGATPQHTLTITDNDVALTIVLGGRGSGTVATTAGVTPAINCTTGGSAAQCTAVYQLGSQVSLVATPYPTSEGINRFEGWSATGTGFTCTTSTTCAVSMSQSRQVTSRFSIPGTLTYVPTSASFTMVERGTTPAATTVSVTNTGERQLLLNSTIPMTYTPTGTAWLNVSINKLAVDTLSPATLTLTVLSGASALNAGTYQASVFVRDDGLQRSWILPVTLTVTPPPTAPTISNVVVSLIALNDASRCTLETPYGSSFKVTFDYTDPNGNGPLSISQAALNINYVFALGSGSFTNYTYMSSLTGNGSTGSANTTQCYRFGSNSSVNVTMTIIDQGGLRSTGATITILKPAGSN